MALKDDIFAAYAPKPVKVEILNGHGVHAKALSGADWFDLLACESSSDRLVLAVVRGACDAKGERIFAEEDAARVRTLPKDFTGPVSDLVLSLSGVGKDTEGKEPSPPSGSSPSA